MDTESYLENLRSDCIELTEKYIKPFFGKELDEFDMLDIADEVFGVFRGWKHSFARNEEMDRLRRQVKRLQKDKK